MPTLPLNWDQDHFRNMIYSHYNSERVRWWQAMPDVSYSSATGNSSSPSGKKWNRVEVTNISQYRCIIYHSRQMQMTGRYGRIPSNEITVTFMADEFQFSYDDFIMPIGVTDYNLTSPPDYPTITLKESVLRGWKHGGRRIDNIKWQCRNRNGNNFHDIIRSRNDYKRRQSTIQNIINLLGYVTHNGIRAITGMD